MAENKSKSLTDRLKNFGKGALKLGAVGLASWIGYEAGAQEYILYCFQEAGPITGAALATPVAIGTALATYGVVSAADDFSGNKLIEQYDEKLLKECEDQLEQYK